MRVAIVYDRLYPETIGGQERYLVALAEVLAEHHHVSYITRRLWKFADPARPFQRIAVAPPRAYYTAKGRRRIWQTVRFGLGVFWHVLRHSQDYDVLHVTSFPWFPLIGANVALRLRGASTLVIVDWAEVWPKEYWRRYAGRLTGTMGHAVQQRCLRVGHVAFAHSKLSEGRLLQEGYSGPIIRAIGLHDDRRDQSQPKAPGPSGPLVIFIGRHIPEKQGVLVPAIIDRARQDEPSLRCEIYGDGPERASIEAEIRRLDLQDAVELKGVVTETELGLALDRAACLLHPSIREGFGLVVVEAAAAGTPAIVVDAPDNACVELIAHGRNGEIVPSGDIEALAEAVVRLVQQRDTFTQLARDWYEQNAPTLTVRNTAETIIQWTSQANDSSGRHET